MDQNNILKLLTDKTVSRMLQTPGLIDDIKRQMNQEQQLDLATRMLNAGYEAAAEVLL